MAPEEIWRFDRFSLFCIFVRKLISVLLMEWIPVADMLRKHKLSGRSDILRISPCLNGAGRRLFHW